MILRYFSFLFHNHFC